jgi:hypothetical protein
VVDPGAPLLSTSLEKDGKLVLLGLDVNTAKNGCRREQIRRFHDVRNYAEWVLSKVPAVVQY